MTAFSRTTHAAEAARLLLVLAGMLLSLGCAGFGPGIAGTPCPVAFVPSQAIDPETDALRARMQLQIRDEEVHLELIAAGRPDEWVVVGLARFGVRLFAVHQRGTTIEVEGAASFELEQLAIWVMDALHRAYWIRAPEPGDAVQDWSWHAEHVHQGPTEDGFRREFSLLGQLDSAPRPATRRVLIEYLRARPGAAGNLHSSASTAWIRNPWCGYEARIAPVSSD